MKARLRNLSPTLGVEVLGVSLNHELPAPVWLEIEKAFDVHGVLVFREQEVDDAAQVRLASRLGRLMTFTSSETGSPSDRIFTSTNLDEAGNSYPPDADEIKLLKLNWLWHIDSCYCAVPTRGVVLRSLAMPTQGGETVFANTAAAYEALPAKLRERIEPLVARHSLTHLVRTQDVPPVTEKELGCMPQADHPLVRRHADGRRSLFLSPPYMETVLGWTPDESQELFNELVSSTVQDRFLYTHRWKPDDIVVWNNRWTMHRVLPFDVTSASRVMRGATILDNRLHSS